jgi:hypothetical protein
MAYGPAGDSGTVIAARNAHESSPIQAQTMAFLWFVDGDRVQR